MKAFQFSSILILLLFISCDSKPTSSTTVSNDIPEKTTSAGESQISPEIVPQSIPIPKPAGLVPLKLNGLYATSTDHTSDIRNVFDWDDATIWETKKGTGPDEGIMLYFSKPTMIKSIKIETVEGAAFSKIHDFILYGNGTPIDHVLPDDEYPIGQELLNIYLRFATQEDIQKTANTIDDEFYNEIRLDRFDVNKKIAVKNIILEGEDGRFEIIAPKMIKGSVEASSTLKAESFAYDPSLLFDARKEFVWVEGAKGNGEGVKLQFNFDEDVNIAGLQIWNGYQRSESHFNSNARLKEFGFGLTGTTLETYQLKSVQGDQKIKLEKPVKGRSFELEIQSAFKGWSYKDLAISEILFFDEADALIGIKSQKTVDNQNLIKKKTKGTVLEKLVDSRVYNVYKSEEYPMTLERSMILRSDGTFVMYSLELSDEFSDVENIMDGNWEIIAADNESATISVFGKFLDFSVVEMYYAGKTDAELSRIFRDKITIKNNTIKGEKLIDAIKF